MNDITKYITESSLILVPAVYIVGKILKGTDKIPDKYIPLILLPIGIILSLLSTGLNTESVIQGVLVTGCAVYINQLSKQTKKDE